MKAKVISWWEKLTQEEKDLLLEFLYSLNLEEYGIILSEGFKGYENYTIEELYQEHIERFNEGVKIK